MREDSFDLEHLPPAYRGAAGNGNGLHDPITVLRAASDLLARANISGQAGLTFGGKRDLFEVLGFKKILMPEDYRDRYKRGGIAKRIVEAFPKATWRGGAELVEDDDPDITTEFEQQWNDLDKRLKVWARFCRADILAGLGPFSAILIGTAGKWEEELSQMSSQEDILYLTPFGPDEVTIDTYVEDLEDPRYGLPMTYNIMRRTSSSRRVTNLTRRIHWSRVVHVADGLLEDDINGTPRLESVWNDLDNLDKVVGGGSEAYWMRVNQGTVFGIDKDVKVDPTQLDKMKAEAEELAHQLRRTFAARGVNVTPLGSNVSPFSAQVQSIISLISGTTGIPQRLLLGSERGELASTQDKENWNVRVQDRREDFAEPIVRQLVDRLQEYGALPETEDYEVRWPELEDLNVMERAEVATKWKGLGTTIVTDEEIRDQVLKLDPLEPTTVDGFPEEQIIGPDGQPILPDGTPDPNAPPLDPNAPPPEPTGDEPLPPDEENLTPEEKKKLEEEKKKAEENLTPEEKKKLEEEKKKKADEKTPPDEKKAPPFGKKEEKTPPDEEALTPEEKKKKDEEDKKKKKGGKVPRY